jgi:formylmethanofuran dehydrogenase subunit E
MGLLAGRWLEMDLPQRDKRLLAIMETDGCAADGVAVATGCWVGRRTMRVLDFGKVAATFVNTYSGRGVRIAPRPTCRQSAAQYAPQARTRWEAYLVGYQHMPDDGLFVTREVTLSLSLQRLLSQEGHRVLCHVCGEEIFNEREVWQAGRPVCRSCAGECYYQTTGATDAPLCAETEKAG